MDSNALAILQAFLNSHDNGARAEWFDPDAPEAFVEWAEGGAAQDGAAYAGDAAAARAAASIRALLEDVTPSAEDVALAREVRDGLIAMIADGRSPADLDGLVSALPVRLGVDAGGVALRADGRGPRAVVAAALLAAHELQVRGDWQRLRLCRGDTCHWAFLDQSKNRSRVWCDMSLCGARAKARAYRARRRTG